MPRVPSYTCAGGVLGEGLYGRVDLNKYQTGLKVCHNFHVAVEGGVEKRFGTYLVGYTKYSDRATRLIPWRIANDDSYIIEFGDNYIRFIRFGGYVSLPEGYEPSVESDAIDVDGFMEVPTSYTPEEVEGLRFTFANDIMFIFSGTQPPMQLQRFGLYEWKFVELDFDPHPEGPTGFGGTYYDETINADNYDVEPVPTEYMVSATLHDGIETKPTGPITVNADLGHRRTRVELVWASVSGAVQYTVYKGQSGIFGFIGRVDVPTVGEPSNREPTTGFNYDSENTYWEVTERLINGASVTGQLLWNGDDVGAVPDNSSTTFIGTDGNLYLRGELQSVTQNIVTTVYSYSVARYTGVAGSFTDRNIAPSYDIVPIGDPIEFGADQFPRVGEFYKQRLIMAATRAEPQSLWGSRPAVINSLTKSIPSQEDDAFKITIVGRERHTIQHMLELKRFLLFTDTSEWVLGTVEDKALGPATIDPIRETNYGIEPNLPPLPIGDRVLFVQGSTGDIRDLGYTFTDDGYSADDLSRLARHIFKNRKIVSWTYGAFPQNLLHCVTSDGALRSMTYVREHEIWGWSTSSTLGTFEDVAAVSESTHDGVYFLIRRTINGVTKVHVERVEVNFNGRIEDMVYVDAALTYRNERPFHSLTRIDATHLEFVVPDHTLSIGEFLSLELFHTGDNAQEILDRDYRVEITSVAGDVIEGVLTRVGDTVESSFLRTSGRAMVCLDEIGGFSHLVGAPVVWALADGKVLKNLVVTNEGKVNLPFRASRVHVGLPYEAAIETLDLDVEGQAGNYSYRAVNDIILRLRNSRAVWAGASTSPRELVLLPSRDNESYYEAPEPLDGPYEIPAHAAWELTCGVRVESRDPLPLNVLNIVPDLVYGT